MKIDLHVCTTVSIGSLGIENLLKFSAACGVKYLGILDRDSISSSIRAVNVAERMTGIEIVTGVEFSATDPETGKRADIICYNPTTPERLQERCQINSNLLAKAGALMAKKVSDRFNIPPKYIAECAQGSVYISPCHIMKALVNCGYTSSIFGELYDELFTPGNKTCVLIEPKFADPRTIIEEIHSAGGIAVLACPELFDNYDLMNKLIEENLIDGIEVYHPLISKQKREELIELAKANNLLVTGGTNFCGAYSKTPVIPGDCDISEQELNALINYKRKG